MWAAHADAGCTWERGAGRPRSLTCQQGPEGQAAGQQEAGRNGDGAHGRAVPTLCGQKLLGSARPCEGARRRPFAVPTRAPRERLLPPVPGNLRPPAPFHRA